MSLRAPPHRRARRGASAIEFALTLPAFLFVVAMLVDWGWVFFQQAMLDTAIQDGCRAGAVTDPGYDDPDTVAEDAIRDLLSRVGHPCDGDCTITLETRGAAPAVSLYCEVNQEVEPLFGFVPVPGRLGSSTLIRYEWQDDIIEAMSGG